MDKSSIAQKRKLYYMHALRIVEGQGVSPNGAAHQFYIANRDGIGRYLAATPEAFPPAGKCSCPDFRNFTAKHNFECEHILAAIVYERAEAHVRQQAKDNKTTWQRIIDLAHGRMAYAQTSIAVLRYRIIIATAERLIAEQREEDRQYCQRHPQPLDHLCQQIRRLHATITDLHSQLRRDPDNAVTQAQLKGLRQTVNGLLAKEQRIRHTWQEAG